MAVTPTKPSDAAATPVTFKVGDDLYEASPLDIGDWDKLQEWIRRGIRADGVRAANNADTSAMCDAVLDRYDVKADEFNLFEIEPIPVDKDGKPLPEKESPEARKRRERAETKLGTPGVMFYLLWLSLRHKHPKLKHVRVPALIEASDESLGSLCERIMERSIPDAGEATSDGGPGSADPST